MFYKDLRAPPIPPITAFPSNGNNAVQAMKEIPLFDLKCVFSF